VRLNGPPAGAGNQLDSFSGPGELAWIYISSEPSVARVGYAVTAFIAREFGGDRRMAERESARRVARLLGISDWKHWSADEITGFLRMAPLLACLPDIERWGAREKHLLARIVRAKGSRRERDYALLASRHQRFRAAVEQLANETTPPAR